MMTRPISITTAKTHQPLALLDRHSARREACATTWVKISIDMPLPMPRSVISSPSHMITAVPAVMVTTMTQERAGAVAVAAGRLVAALEQAAGAGQRHDAGRLQEARPRVR